ncbi:MarC family protein [Dongshaea marina]|uniref:MarC family protein n=1 Tax=Dongshaea marina TaxID=2047966 RepID=UPI000D3E0FC4|nr:MarC family protein [Dongshaea marina]
MLAEKFIRDGIMLLATIDPVGTLSIFAGLTAGLSGRQQRRIAFKAICYSAIILVGAVVIGQVLLTAMGVKLISLQVAGGIILFLFGLQMIFGNPGGKKEQTETDHDLAVFPLAVPSIASPGAIMAVIVLTDNHLYSIPVQAGTTLILLGVLAITFLLMLAAAPILKVIGQNGAAILIRVMGMILAALSIEVLLSALGVPGWS